jgi:hypothetical protein
MTPEEKARQTCEAQIRQDINRILDLFEAATGRAAETTAEVNRWLKSDEGKQALVRLPDL